MIPIIRRRFAWRPRPTARQSDAEARAAIRARWQQDSREDAERQAQREEWAGMVLRSAIPAILATEPREPHRFLITELLEAISPDKPATYTILRPRLETMSAILQRWPDGDFGLDPELVTGMRDAFEIFVGLNTRPRP